MNTRFTLTTALAVALSVPVFAGEWAPGITIDGNMDDWDGQVPAVITDASGDGGSGRDVKAIYLANDANNLYVRIESYNSDAYDGNELSGVDGDNSTSTGFNLFGGGIGSDLLVAGASMFGETTTNFNNGAATPSSLSFGPYVATTDVEFAIPLTTTIPGDILQAFPGGLGSTISFIYGDANSGATDVAGPVQYTLASNPGVAPFNAVIDDFEALDSTANAQKRTHVGTVSAGCSVTRDSDSGVSGYGLKGVFTTAAQPWVTAQIGRRFAKPLNISNAANVLMDVKGDAGATQEMIWLGLIDADGTYLATTDVAVPTTTGWTTLSFGDPASWYLQAGGANNVLDLDQIVEWRIGVSENGTGQGGTFTLVFDNLKVQKATVGDWMLY